jgi:hypothetical protein
VTSRPALRPVAAKRSWPVARIAELAGRRILRLTAPPHLIIGHHRGADLRPGSEPSARRQPAGWADPEKARGEALAAAIRVGRFSRQAQAVCRAYTWPASSGPPRALPAARAAPVRADPERPARGAYRQCPDALVGRGPGVRRRQAVAAAPRPDHSSSRPAFRARPGPWESRGRSGVVVTRSRAVSQGGRPPRTVRAARSHRGSAGPDAMPRRRLAGRHTTRRHAGRRAAGFAVPEPPGRPGRPG